MPASLDAKPVFTPVAPPRRRKRAPAPVAAPAVPTLVAASFGGSNVLTLTFAQAVDVAAGGGGVDPDQFVVADGPAELTYGGMGAATVVDATTIQLTLLEFAAASGPDVLLTVSAGNGIVSADGQTPWPRVTHVALPLGA